MARSRTVAGTGELFAGGGDVRFFNEDCVAGCARHLADGAVDLIITDPPYGIEGDKLHRHYRRREAFVLDGYVEVPREKYAAFSRAWVRQAERILRPGGAMYVVSGWTNLADILNALRETSLSELNHVIWKYNFGPYTRRKFVSSHVHVLYWVKPGAPHTFNAHCRYGPLETDDDGGRAEYLDREDVWTIPREYKPGRAKNKNELPQALLVKMLQYSSGEGDLVADLFLGSFATAKAAVGLNRRAVGFELSRVAFRHGTRAVESVAPGSLLGGLRRPAPGGRANQGKRWTPETLDALAAEYDRLRAGGDTKGRAIEALCERLGRGRFAVLNALERAGR